MIGFPGETGVAYIGARRGHLCVRAKARMARREIGARPDSGRVPVLPKVGDDRRVPRVGERRREGRRVGPGEKMGWRKETGRGKEKGEKEKEEMGRLG